MGQGQSQKERPQGRPWRCTRRPFASEGHGKTQAVRFSTFSHHKIRGWPRSCSKLCWGRHHSVQTTITGRRGGDLVLKGFNLEQHLCSQGDRQVPGNIRVVLTPPPLQSVRVGGGQSNANPRGQSPSEGPRRGSSVDSSA